MTALRTLASPLSDRAHSWFRQALFAGGTSFTSSLRFPQKLESLRSPCSAKARYARSDSARILGVMSPATMGDGNIYFQLHDKIPKDEFDRVLKIFRDYKKKKIANCNFDWDNRMWKMEDAAIR
eukprot:scaffold2992_cov214-Amphora_coffeaeformis.AAC.24